MLIFHQRYQCSNLTAYILFHWIRVTPAVLVCSMQRYVYCHDVITMTDELSVDYVGLQRYQCYDDWTAAP